jgi:hypothetical protein
MTVDTGMGYMRYTLTGDAGRQISLELDDSSDGEEETYMSDTPDLPDYDE